MTALSDYLEACRQTHANPHTTERSWYPALQRLIEVCSDGTISAHSELSLSGGNNPDLGIYTVQAIVYGMFATWLESDEPDKFEWRDTPDELSVDVIAEIVHAALPPAVVREGSVRLLLEGVAGVLRRVDRNALAEAFDDRAQRACRPSVPGA